MWCSLDDYGDNKGPSTVGGAQLATLLKDLQRLSGGNSIVSRPGMTEQQPLHVIMQACLTCVSMPSLG